MTVVKNLMVRAGADFSGMRREMQKAQQNIRGFKDGMNNTLKGIGAALATLGIGAVIKDAVKSAMQVEASMQQINRTMGSSALSFMDWANKSAISFNMGRSDAIKFGAVYSNLISGFAKDTGATMKYTQDLLKASAVVASGTGRTMEDVMERIRSGMLGNTEAIEDLGINVNVAMIESTNAFKKFANGKSWQQLDFQTQQQIRLFAILEQSTQKYGDAVANNTNSKQQQFVAQLQNTQLSLGQAFLPIYNIVLPALTSMAAALSNAMSVVAQFTQALFGKSDTLAQTKATTQQAASVNNLGDAYTAAGQAAKGSIAGFDEVNNLADNSGSGSGGAAAPKVKAASASPVAGIGDPTQGVSAKVQEMANKVKAAFGEMSDFISTHKEIIVAALAGLGAAFATFLIATNWAAIVGGISTAFGALGAVIAFIVSPIGLAMAAIAGLTAAAVYFYQTNETFRGVVDSAFQAIGVAAQWLWQNVLVPLGSFLSDNFVPILAGIAAGLATYAIAVSGASVVTTIWSVIAGIAAGVTSALGTAIAFLLSPIGIIVVAVAALAAAFVYFYQSNETFRGVVDGILKAIGDTAVWLWQNVLVPLGQFLSTVFVAAWGAVTTAAEWLWKNVFEPLGNFLLWFWQSVIAPLASILADVLAIAFQTVSAIALSLWQNVLVPLGAFFAEVLGPTVEALSAIFMFLWNNALAPLAEFIGSVLMVVFGGLTDVIVFLWNNVLEPLVKFVGGTMLTIFSTAFGAIGEYINGLKKILIGLMTFITGVFTGDWGKAWEGIKQIFQGVFDSLWAIVKFPINLIIDGINVLIDGLNAIHFDIPDWIPLVGGKSFGISIGHIPKLAKGGITNGPMMAMIGDNPGGQEVVSPLDGLLDMIQSAVGTAVMAASQFNNNRQGDVVIQLDGTTLARVLSPYTDRENSRVGSPMITTAGAAMIVTT